VPRLRKALGQHHLRHGDLCLPAVEFLQPAGRLVIEIGPGGGVLSEQLVQAGARVVGWELDVAWALELGRRPVGSLMRLVVGDALDIPWNRLPAGTLVAGNLPYAVASPLIRGLLLEGVEVERAAFLVQAEVAERLASEPGSRTYGYSSVLAAASARVEILARVAAGSFRPPPKVDGAFVGLRRREPPFPVAQMPAFLAVVAAAFRSRRKTVANSLATEWGRPTALAVLAASAIEPRRRAETLSLEELVRVYRNHRDLQAQDTQKSL
jgi:16S rRNA (adenine1518-N6/adenine1519-N6)-dimethyltransferase